MKLLMVCLGNICRSPLAEGIMRHKMNILGLDWEVDSAGTSGYHAGERPDERSIAIAQAHNIDISNQRSRQFQEDDFSKFDMIFVMDSTNYRDVKSLARTKEEEEKIALIMNEAKPGMNQGVPDPYWDNDGFEGVYQMLDLACERFIQKMTMKANQ